MPAERKECTKPQVCGRYDISLSSFKRHKKGWANFKVEAGAAAKPEDYFLKIPSAGRPTFLSPDEEQLIAEMLAGMGDLACGKQADRTLALICRVADAVGNLHVRGSRQLFAKFMERNGMPAVAAAQSDATGLKVVKPSNLSKNRAKALTIEKFTKMFQIYVGMVERLREQGRLAANEWPDPECLFNTDEAHPGSGKFNAVVVGANTKRAFRLVDGEKVEWHASAVITTSAMGDLLRRCCGVVHQATGKTCGGDLAEGLPVSRFAPFFALTPGGGMDESSFLKLAKLFAGSVGKQQWDCSKPWNEQPGQGVYADFEPRPVFWLLDGHYSHTCPEVLSYCRDHDIHVLFTVAGASEVDQVCDCGIMACLQAEFGGALTEWKEQFPSIPFQQWNWNSVYTTALDSIQRNRRESMRSAWAKTGWYPYLGLKAANYDPKIFLTSAVLDDKGADHVDEQSDVPLQRQATEVIVLTSARPTDSKGAVIRKAAWDTLNQTVVKPAAEQRKVWQEIYGKKRARTTTTAVDESDDSDYESDVEADNTGFGAEGTSAAFIARRERQLYKRERKARRKAKTAEERKKKATEDLQLAMQQGIKIELRLESGTTIDDLTVADLKALLKARGGSTGGSGGSSGGSGGSTGGNLVDPDELFN